MGNRLWFFRFALLLAVTLFARETSAYCIGWDKTFPGYRPDYYSPAEEYERALYVIEVRALSEIWLGEDGKPAPLKRPFQDGAKRPWGFDPYVGSYYEVEVLRTYKGKPPRRFRVFSENSTARCHLWVGKKYLLFVTQVDWPESNQHTVDNCGNSGFMDRAAKTLKYLRKRPTPSG